MVIGTAAAGGEPRPATVSFTHFGMARDLVWRVDEECFVAPPVALRWGWTTSLAGETASVTVDGRRVDVPLARIGKTPALPLRQILEKLDGGSAWRAGTDTLDVWGVVKSATIDDGTFTLEASLATKPKITRAENPPRVVVDLPGLKLDNKTSIALGPRAKVEQQPGGVRMILETDETPVMVGMAQQPARVFRYDLKKGYSGDLSPVESTGDASGSASEIATTAPPVTPRQAQLPVAGPLTLSNETKASALLGIQLPPGLKEAPTVTRPEPAVIEVLFPGAKFESESPAGSSIESIEVRDTEKGAVLAIRLVRPMGVEIATVTSEMQIRLLKPEVGNGKLAGKVIVVDAGHGGSDTGARSPDKKIAEKDLTLPIAKKLAQRLAAQGATVIMTRKTDVAVELHSRPDVANRNKADLFLSVHINSNTTGKTSGGMTFYHMQDPISALLAECVQREIAKVSKLPDFGAKSDRILYQSGLAVLRGAKMPAILMELGFLNHPTDRKRMLTDEFQDAVADAVVQGLKVYLGDGKAKEE
ncbi:MAG: N-acetylmuramoyl-L-alanine amidase [Fimbriimonadaceae bacterium]|nr:N-acetylmuramoyl-L-alanine amidase [Fimbriimonadaceae bacterium]